MNRQEFAQFVAALRSYYPKEKLLPTDESADLWYDALKDLDYRAASEALRRWANTEKWSPSIAEIRAWAANAFETNPIMDWSDGWKEVTRAISNYGSWNKEAALESMSPITRQCVQSIGWENICGSENIGVERGHFRTMYADKSEKIAKARQMPESLRTPAERIMLDFSNKLKLN